MLRIQTALLYLLLGFCCPIITKAQVKNLDGSMDCTEPTLIQVSREKIEMLSSGDYESAADADHVVFYKESDRYTFWYKIAVSYSCDLQFDIYPTDPHDYYNFYLYKYEGSNFCKGIIDNSVRPFRANLFERIGVERGSGINKSIEGERMESVNSDDYFYFRPRKQVIEAKQGDIYYLNVHHLVGEDCGHSVVFASCEKSLEIEAKHKPCYEPVINPVPVVVAMERLKDISSIASIAATPLSVLEVEDIPQVEVDDIPKEQNLELGLEMEYVTFAPMVFDARTEQPMEVDYTIVEKATGERVERRVNGDGETELNVNPEREYTIYYSSLGYESRQMDINFGVDKQELNHERIFLKPKGVGTSIVLNDIYFHPNTYVFRAGADEELKRLLHYLKSNGNVRIEIQGHTNGDYRVKPKPEYAYLGESWNFRGSSAKLSKLRAGVVGDYLTDNGVDPNRLIVTGLGGKHMIIADPDDYEDRLVNMRVEIVILEI